MAHSPAKQRLLKPGLPKPGPDKAGLLKTGLVKTWLVKTEPSTYSFADLVRDGRTPWTGVKNAAAQIHLKAMSAGDEVFIYHTGAQKAVVGCARVLTAAYADPTQRGALACVDLAPEAPLARAVSLAEVKADARWATFDLVRHSRLSVMPVPADAARWILAQASR